MSVKISLHGDGLSFETEASVLQAAQVIGFLGNDNSTGPNTGSVTLHPETTQPILSVPTKILSPREKLIEVRAKTNAQKILTFGQFIIERDHTENFSITDVKSLFGRAREPVPRNLGRDIKDAVRLGYIYDDESVSDHYVVTGKGLELLGVGFGSEPAKTTRTVSSRKHTSQKASSSPTVSQEVKDMQVNDIAENLPNYRMLAQKSDRLMWILAYTQTKGIEKLTPKEIEDIAQRLSDNIPARQIAPFTQTALKKGYLSKTSEGYRILFSGTQYLQDKITKDETSK